MSAPHFSWALRMRDLKPAQRLVLCAIAERANGDLACWPSIAVIANDVELTERAVYRAVDFLVNERKLIRKVIGEEREQLLTNAGCKGDVRANVYQLKRTIVPDEDEHSSPINGYDPEHSSPSPLNTVHPEHSSPLNTVQFDPDSESLEPTIESTRERTLLRNGEPAPTPPAADEPPSVRKILYDEGLPILGRLTGRGRGGCAELLGRLRKEHDDDCAAILGALRRAQDMDPVGAMAFVQGALKHAKAKPKRETMAEMQTRMLAEIDAAGNA